MRVRPATPRERVHRRDDGACAGADRVRLEVADDGPGIAAEHLPHLFDRFYRADPGRPGSGSPGGSGLGLAIVQANARAHGGTCAVRSEPGRGAAFALDLPVRGAR